MEVIKYNSRSEIFKNPFGAVKTDEKINFSLHVSKAMQPLWVRLVVRMDGKTESIYIFMQKSGDYDGFDVFSCTASFPSPDLYFYRFEINTSDGIKYVGLKNGIADIGEWLSEWQLTVYNKNFKTPKWVRGGIMYQIFPDRFAKSSYYTCKETRNSRKIHDDWYDVPQFIYDTPDYKADDFFCGNILGIIEKLPYLKSLGVSVIYLNPVFESPENHRYSTADYMNIDPYFGTNEQFSYLCSECKRFDIRVILDGVFSHTGADSIYFNKYSHYESTGAYNSKSSPYYSWYTFNDYPDKYESWWGFSNLPNVNETNPEYMEYITGDNGVIEYWQKTGASGWRLDVADELPDEFLEGLYSRSKSVCENSFIIGEVWEDATNKFAYGKRRKYLLGGQMDSVMNYPWRTAILEFVKNADEIMFHERIISILENYPPDVSACLMNSISTHDTLRAITYLGVEHEVKDEEKGKYIMTSDEYEKGRKRLLQATFLQFTLPGIPCIYYGDEVGLQGFRDPYCRMCYPYGKEDFTIMDFYKEISKTRVKHREDFTSKMELYTMKKGLYAFLRGNLLCAINLGDNKEYIKTENKKIIFEYGENIVSNHGIELMSGSMVILN